MTIFIFSEYMNDWAGVGVMDDDATGIFWPTTTIVDLLATHSLLVY